MCYISAVLVKFNDLKVKFVPPILFGAICSQIFGVIKKSNSRRVFSLDEAAEGAKQWVV